LPDAASLQSAIKDKYGVVADLIEGHGGAFEVVLNGNRIFSKLKTFRFPAHEEIFTSIDNL
jgi:selT/selW/selH-like putative selenoprotein